MTGVRKLRTWWTRLRGSWRDVTDLRDAVDSKASGTALTAEANTRSSADDALQTAINLKAALTSPTQEIRSKSLFVHYAADNIYVEVCRAGDNSVVFPSPCEFVDVYIPAGALVNADAIREGTLPDARLSSAIARTSALTTKADLVSGKHTSSQSRGSSLSYNATNGELTLTALTLRRRSRIFRLNCCYRVLATTAQPRLSPTLPTAERPSIFR